MRTGITSIHEYFKELPDPRKSNRTRHLLMDMLTIALCAIVGGAESFNDMELFGKMKKEWLQSFLELPGGIPSHDTFNRVFSMLDPASFNKCFIAWTQALAKKLDGVLAIDGKTLRRSFSSASKKTALHIVSMWSAKNELVMGQICTEAKSNEITAVPKLLEMLDIRGCIVTIDAMGCQRETANKILEREADYVLALKGNQGNMFDAAKYLFDWEKQNDYRGVLHARYETIEKDHGRIEKREVHSIGNLEEIEEFRGWPGLKSVTMVVSTREVTGKAPTTERRCYLSSLTADAKKIGDAVRAHWGIENKLHWVLDVHFREDYARNRTDHSAENMAMMRHMALNLLKREKTSKTSLRGKRLKASWNDDYILQLLALA